MDHESQVDVPGDRPETPSGAPQDSGRRALLRGGVATAPVVLSLVSRPVSAANNCVVASSFVSVTTFRSRNPTVSASPCASKNCESWYSDACLPEIGLPSRPAFLSDTVATLLGATTSQYSGQQLWAVLKNAPYGVTQSGELGVLQHLICLTLNLQKGYMPVVGNLSVSYVKSVWQNFMANNGRYRLPASGIDWDAGQVVTWARVLMYPLPG